MKFEIEGETTKIGVYSFSLLVRFIQKISDFGISTYYVVFRLLYFAHCSILITKLSMYENFGTSVL